MLFRSIAIAGSWDNFVYAFYPWGRTNYFSNTLLYWKFDAEEDVYSAKALDLGGIGYDNYILVGVGNHLTDEGKVVVLDMNGTKLWEFSTTCVPEKIQSSVNIVDLDHDGDKTHLIAGYCNTIEVQTNSGDSVWTYSTNDTISSVYYADFDGDGEHDDVLAGAGNYLYAINNTGNLLWTLNTNGSIHSITKMGRDYEVEYYLIGTGTKLIAFTGSEQEGSILWEYETGINFESHRMVDFDGDRKLDDIILTDGKKVYAYDFGIIFPPRLVISKSVSATNMTLGQNLVVDVVLNNKGSGIANGVSVIDQIPGGFQLLSGETSWNFNSLNPLKNVSFNYTINASKVGNYTLPGVIVTHSDKYGVDYRFNTDNIYVNVTEPPKINISNISQSENNLSEIVLNNSAGNFSNGQFNNSVNGTLISGNISNNVSLQNVTSEPTEVKSDVGPPQLTVSRIVSKNIIQVGENTTVDIFIRNFGESPAVEII